MPLRGLVPQVELAHRPLNATILAAVNASAPFARRDCNEYRPRKGISGACPLLRLRTELPQRAYVKARGLDQNSCLLPGIICGQVPEYFRLAACPLLLSLLRQPQRIFQCLGIIPYRHEGGQSVAIS